MMRRAWSLQRRLVVALVLLLAVLSGTVGAASAFALQQNLLQRLDGVVTGDLHAVENRLSGQPNFPDAQDPLGARASVGLAMKSGDPSTAEGFYRDEDHLQHELTAAQNAQLIAGATSNRPSTVTIDGVGEFRAAKGETGGVTYVVGITTEEVVTTTSNLILIFALVTLVALAIAALVGTWVVRVALRPLDRVAATATRVSELPLAKGEVALAERVADVDTDPRTEVGKVGSAFNRMLGHVESALVSRQQSEDKVRQFVADASHELRTPLASIRGYSELTRRGGHELPEDVVRALGRIESESVRMTSLVEDLLLLARLDAGRELVLGDVDLTPLMVDAVSDAHAASPDHEWSLDAPETPVIVTGDGGRLHQVIANLLANARVHTPTGTKVEAGLRTDGGFAVITVQDDGPGISAGLQSVLFERFARGDGSRARATGSTGLGLSIVAAVAEGHDGTVGVESEPGRTVFTVRLPLKVM